MNVKIIKTIKSYYTNCQTINEYVEMQVKNIDGQVKDVCARIPSNELCLRCERRHY